MKASGTVLIADDDAHARKAIRLRLSQAGYRPVEACDGIGVLTRYLADQADAIILDHCMPGADGASIARVIRRESTIPIIFLSGCGRETFRQVVYELPDSYYVSKTAGADQVMDLLRLLVPHNKAASGGRPASGQRVVRQASAPHLTIECGEAGAQLADTALESSCDERHFLHVTNGGFLNAGRLSLPSPSSPSFGSHSNEVAHPN